ncbi:hypothetical protein PYCCODRAFT_17517 [Trametes coccinea BRFM310]|uniref:Uncharacterized protein n=1 Tax=Trametes coccinea (strain BRFM310) TaxID=1353009 RepID=A0A1Y2J6I9_TRAC3|nr:hypothetical protein PYCCODRAFT_17517 [Trametes coccinea BRFM310]
MVPVEGSSNDPATRLPVELTTKIFGYVRSESRDLKWLRITLVCPIWRRLAIGTPLFWCDIHIGIRWTPEIVDAFIRRSKGLRLKVGVDERTDEHELATLFEQLAPHAFRFRSLSLEFDLKQMPVVQKYLARLGTSISTLHLAAYFYASSDSDDLLTGRGLAIRAKDLPALRELSLDGVVLNAQPPFLARLQKLHMRDIWYFERFARYRRVDQYLHKLLSACINLEDLCLCDVLHPTIPIKTPAVHLPQLRALRLGGEGNQVANTVSFFSVPPTTTIAVTSDWEIATWFRWAERRLPRVFSTALPRPAADHEAAYRYHNTRALRFQAGTTCFEVQGYTKDTATPCQWSGSVELSSLGLDYRTLLLKPALSELKEIVKPSRIVQLEIHLAPQLRGFVDWVWLFNTFTNVQDLTIGGPTTVVHFFCVVMGNAGFVLQERIERLKSLSFCLPAMDRNALEIMQEAAQKSRWLFDGGSLKVHLLVRPSAIRDAELTLGDWKSKMSRYGVKVHVATTECKDCLLSPARPKPGP